MAKLHILVDNQKGHQMAGEHGLSIFIESDVNILFDSGQSDLFIRNARKMGLDLNSLSAIALSHGHDDHGNGLKFLKGFKLFAHPLCFSRRYSKKDRSYSGLSMCENEAKHSLMLQLSKEPVWISRSIVFLGEIPRIIDFEAQNTDFIDEKGEDDYLLDDSAIAIKRPNGLILITGCSHSGICNIAAHAIKVTGSENIHTIIGGLHLLNYDQKTRQTIDTLQKMKVKMVMPMHCTCNRSFLEFSNAFGSPRVRTGDTLTI
jgi:7,8-dihydropterin-6-yl-methyl-4-(beta-D-ribofuranosyl)aminobenzene 5'-phosphate synthase